MQNNPDNTTRCSIVRKIRSASWAVGLIFSALSLPAQTPPPGPDSAMITAIVDISVEKEIPIWCYENKVMADFSALNGQEVAIYIYDLCGRLIVNEAKKSRDTYMRELDRINADYILVSIITTNRRVTKKLWITNFTF